MRTILFPLLLVAVIASGMGVAYAKHSSRKLFIELQALEAERDSMNVEWGQLQLEQSTHTTHGKVEFAARKRLGMKIPDPQQIVILRR
ncbi:MAG TPA: cell division protein FtsL [Gammaproteobacteria bacterium]|mgnify:CR=1 FL=1|nr:cell division protein FtsL [Gammaproteobacteria bacterium]